MQEIASNKENVNLLWTGGWDSTFQLLQLLIIHRQRVTPFYLIDAERRSAGMEIRAIKRIKERLLKEHPHVHELLQPTRYFAVADISPDTEITEAFQSILKEIHLGSQYEFLARFCKENGITYMQIGNQADRVHNEACFDFEGLVSERTGNTQPVFRVDPKFRGTNEYVLFRYFSFPIIRITKIQIHAMAKERGWEGIMGMTWFCQSPTKYLKPCGKCIPCSQTMTEGLGWRIPVRSRIVSFFYKRFYLPIKPLAKTILSKLGLLKYIQKSTT